MIGVRRCVVLGLWLGLAAAMAVAAEREETPDVSVQAVLVRDAVLRGQEIPVRIVLSSRGYVGRTAEVRVLLDGLAVARRPVVLSGKVQFVEVKLAPRKRAGAVEVEVRVSPFPGEALEENNRQRRSLRVIEGVVKVLYVEGSPRWEYRYLRAILLRDSLADAKFVLTGGGRDPAKASGPDLAAFPEAARGLSAFDLVILGDLPERFLTGVQLRGIEEFVRRQGGALLVLAGQQHGLTGYIGTPIEALLPVRLRPGGMERVGRSVRPVPTEAGWRSGVARLALSRKENQELWGRVGPLHSVPALAGAKPAATVLLTLSDAPPRKQPYPLMAWQRCGSGKVLFVGTDRLWRLRYREGDKYHARFWQRAIRFLALSHLLPPRRIQLGTGRRHYPLGGPVQIYANVLSEGYEPVSSPTYKVSLERLDAKGEAVAVVLRPAGGLPGLYHGEVTPRSAGRYRLRAGPADREASSVVEFRVAVERGP